MLKKIKKKIFDFLLFACYNVSVNYWPNMAAFMLRHKCGHFLFPKSYWHNVIKNGANQQNLEQITKIWRIIVIANHITPGFAPKNAPDLSKKTGGLP